MAFQAPLSWLEDFVEINMPPNVIAERLTIAGLEVEKIEKIEKNTTTLIFPSMIESLVDLFNFFLGIVSYT